MIKDYQEEWEEAEEKIRLKKEKTVIYKMIDYCCSYRDVLAMELYEWLYDHLDHVIEDDGRDSEYILFDGHRYLTGQSNGMDGDAYDWVPTSEYNNCYLR